MCLLRESITDTSDDQNADERAKTRQTCVGYPGGSHRRS